MRAAYDKPSKLSELADDDTTMPDSAACGKGGEGLEKKCKKHASSVETSAYINSLLHRVAASCRPAV